MINEVILIGRAGKTPELYTTKSEKQVVKFTLATWENYKDESSETGWRQETEWHNIVVWGASAETLSKKVKKGGLVFVKGAIRTRSYQDKDGATKYITEIVGFAKSLEKKPDADKPEPKPEAPAVEPEKKGKPIVDEDDLPF